MFAKDYRELARENLRGNWKLSIGTALIACLLGGMIIGSIFWPEMEIKIENMNFRSVAELMAFVISNFGFAFVAGGLLNQEFVTCSPGSTILVPVSARHSCGICIYSFGACCLSSPASSPPTAMP